MLSAFRFNFLFAKIIFLQISVFLSVQCDVGDLGRVFLSPHPAYLYPQPPIQFDEEPTHIYLPPPAFADENPVFPAPYPLPEDYLPPSSIPVYLPPPSNDVFPPVGAPFPPSSPNDDTVVIPALPSQNAGVYPPHHAGIYPPNQALLPPKFKIENMSCIEGLNFRVTFKMAGDLYPVVDDATDACITPLSNGMFRIDLESFNGMLKCGVRRCVSNNVPQVNNLSGSNNTRSTGHNGNNMCVILRMPTVRGVRLPEDQMVTLVCTPQERVVSRTRHVRLGSNKILQNPRARSTHSFFATGGSQKELKSKISIFRKRSGTNVFDQSVQPENVIQLGEELVLRAIISDEDGWESSRIGPVLITGVKSKKSALLVNQYGCVNPVMKSICPQQPQKLNPFSTEFHFRAFLFQESPQGDEMIVSVRTQGCLHTQDCIKAESCRDDIPTSRSKRELTFSLNNGNANTDNNSEDVKKWESQLFFKVEPFSSKRKNVTKSQKQEYFFFVYLTIMVFLTIVIIMIFLLWKLYSKKTLLKETTFRY